MKHRIRLTLAAMALLVSTVSVAQIEEGVITGKETMDSDNPELKGQLAMVGEITRTTYLKGALTRMEASSAMTGTNVTIYDQEKKEGVIMMENPFMGKKFIRVNEEQAKKMKGETEYEVETTKETKKILGYTCNKYIVITDNDDEIVLYATKELNSWGIDQYDGQVPGAILREESEQSMMGMTIQRTYEVTEIKEQKVDKKKFDTKVPDGYEETTFEELKNSMPGG